MKILILGSNGLVGSSLKRILNEEGLYNVTASTRSDTDLFSLDETKKLLEKVRPDLLINAAAKVGGIYANDNNRTDFLLENIKINLNVLEAIKDFPDTGMINLGSSCIYPLDAPNPISEDMIMSGKLEPTNSPYAIAKLTAIELGDSISKEYGNKIINLMPTNLYGPGDNFDALNSHVIPGLIYRMYKAKKDSRSEFKIWGSGKPLREFLYVDDLSYAVKYIIENDIDEKLLNIGSGYEISIYSLAEKIKNLLSFSGELAFDASKPDGNPRKLLDSSKILNLGWTPKFNIDEGLENTYKWFKDKFS